jgi:hypothetical protein
LKATPEGLTPTEVRSRLEAAGFNFAARYTNLLANIHIVLKRLEQNDEAVVIEAENATGKRYYWALNPPLPKGAIGELLESIAKAPLGSGAVRP